MSINNMENEKPYTRRKKFIFKAIEISKSVLQSFIKLPQNML